MQKSHYVFRSLSVGLSSAIAVALLAGCGSSQAINPAAGGASGMSSIHSGIPAVKGGCKAHGGVRVSPCTVDLTVSNPGPDTVTVRLPQNKKGTLSESDNCTTTTSGVIAVVAPGTSADTYTVTAGTMAGSCTATFSYKNKRGKLIGYADLSITNSI